MKISKKKVESFASGKEKTQRALIKRKRRKRNKFNAGFLDDLNSLKQKVSKEEPSAPAGETDPELEKLLRLHRPAKAKAKGVDQKAYQCDLNEFLSKDAAQPKFGRPREYRKKKKGRVTLEDINTQQKGILVRQKKGEQHFGLESLAKGGNDGTKSIVNLKLPSEVLKEKAKVSVQNPEADRKIMEDLKKLPNSVFLTELGDNGDGNRSTFYMMQLLKSRGINKSKSIVSKKERYEKFLDQEKVRNTDDAGEAFYGKMLDNMLLERKGEALKFDKQRFLRKKKPIIIEYRNKDGQILDKKESFNEMCLKFHGVKRSVTKVERLRKYKEKRQLEQSKTNSFALPSFFKGAKNITNKAYINLSKDLN